MALESSTWEMTQAFTLGLVAKYNHDHYLPYCRLEHVFMAKPLAKKVLLVGWDAADWKVIHPLMDAGEMPAGVGMEEVPIRHAGMLRWCE